jgi:hypothetical protein
MGYVLALASASMFQFIGISVVRCEVLVVEMVRLVSWGCLVWLRCCKGGKITDLCNCRCEMVVRRLY